MLDKGAKGIIAEGTPQELKEVVTDSRVHSFFHREAPDNAARDEFYVR
jgi:hypothetical protein